MIRRIQATGFKGADIDLNLGGLDMLLGPPGSGKTEALQAIEFAALGYVREVGKDLDASAQLMRNGELTVSVDLDGGESFTRKIVRSGKGLKRINWASWLPADANSTAVGVAISELFGSSEIAAAEHLDLRALLQATGPDRVKRIQDLLDASGVSVEELQASASALYVMRLAGVEGRAADDPEQLAKMADGARALLPPDLVGVDAIERELVEWLVSGLAEAAEKVNAAKLKAKREEDGAAKGQAAIEDRSVERQSGPAERADDLRTKRDEVAARLAGAERDMVEAARHATAKGTTEEQLPALRAAVLEAEQRATAAAEALPRVAEADEERAGIVQFGPPDPPVVVQPDAEQLKEADALELEAKNEDTLAEDIAEQMPDPIDLSGPEFAVERTAAELARAEASPWHKVTEICADIESLADYDSRIADAAEEIKALAKSQIGDVVALRTARDEADRNLVALRDQALKRSLERERLKGLEAAHRNAARTKRHEAANIRQVVLSDAQLANQKNATDYSAARTKYEAQVAEVETLREQLRKEASSIRDAAAETSRELERARSRVAEVEAKLAGIGECSIDAKAARATADETTEQFIELDVKLKAAEEAAARRSELQALIRQCAQAQSAFRCYSAAEWALKKLRADDTARRSQGIEQRMATVIEAAGRTEVPFVRVDGAKALRVGWLDGEAPVSVATLSGHEAALFGVALEKAIHGTRKPQESVLLIEANDSGIDWWPELRAACEATGLQCVVASNLPIEASDAWTVHRMTVTEREMVTA